MLQEIERSCLAVVCFRDFFPPFLPLLFFSSAVSFLSGAKKEQGIKPHRHHPETLGQSLTHPEKFSQADTTVSSVPATTWGPLSVLCRTSAVGRERSRDFTIALCYQVWDLFISIQFIWHWSSCAAGCELRKWTFVLLRTLITAPHSTSRTVRVFLKVEFRKADFLW